ncbi:MAG: outer membrane beta-barrel protein [Vibrionaceae bacterium]
MKKVLALALPLVISAPLFANEGVMPKDKSGHTAHVSISILKGDLSDKWATQDQVTRDEYSDVRFSVGYDYTTKDGVIIGGYYMPMLISKSATNRFDTQSSMTADVLGFYSGYQFDNNIRVTGGLSFTHAEGYVIAEENNVILGSQTNMGFMIGLDYLVEENFLIGSRLSSHDIYDLQGTAIGFHIGYKF